MCSHALPCCLSTLHHTRIFCCSFDILRDDLGNERTQFPHTMYVVAGTQAARAQDNYTALLKVTGLGQGRHGKRKPAAGSDDEMEDSDER